VRLRVLVLVVLGLTLAACGVSQTVPPTTQSGIGVVTGFVDACQSTVLNPPPSEVRVRLYFGPTLVASETTRSGDTYRFSVAPGLYRVAVLLNGLNGKAFTVGAGRRVTVAAGRKVTANLVACTRTHGTLDNTTSAVPTTSTARPRWVA
jgi:hypothetical protein